MRRIGLVLAFLVVVACGGLEAQNRQAWTEPVPPGASSSTYADTVRMLKAMQEDDGLGALFAIGDLRIPDLVQSCQAADEDLSGAALFALQLMGTPECRLCAARFGPVAKGVCVETITQSDLAEIEKALAPRPCEKAGDCTSEDNLPPLNIFALILDGSPQAESVLKRIYELDRTTGKDTFDELTWEEVKAMTADGKKLACNVRITDSNLEQSIRSSAFFIPEEYRDRAGVRFLARNAKGDRMLLEVYFRCGPRCGTGYHVVLRKAGSAWEYALIQMAWIS